MMSITPLWDYDFKTNALKVVIPENFRNKLWAIEFGDLYKLLEENKVYKVYFDISLLEWIDPIPLMSLLVLFRQRANVQKRCFIININEVVVSNEYSYENKSCIVLKFLLDEGFIERMGELGVFYSKGIEIENEELKSRINNWAVDLNYFNCHLMRVRIFDSQLIHEDGEDAAFYNAIESIIEEINVNLLNKKIQAYYFENILYRIRLFFSETINNVYKHAYPDEKKKNIAIYCRYRYGLQNNSIENYKDKLKKLLEREVVNSSALYKDCRGMIYNMREGCVELFVVDVGIGIAESSGFRRKEKAHPTRKAYKDIFNTSPDRINSKDKNQTLNGGLYVICKHIEETQDFVLFKDREEWLGGVLPDRRHNSYFDVINAISNHTPGCVIQATFSWHPFNYEMENWKVLKDNYQKKRLLLVYKKRDFDISVLDDYSIIDERFDYIPDVIAKKNYIKHSVDSSRKKIIYLPHSGMTKHLLAFVIIPSIAENAAKESELIIADIPDNERMTYDEAMNIVTYSQKTRHLLRNISRIVFVSVSLSYCVYRYDGAKYVIDKDGDDLMVSLSNISLSNILGVLIVYDSFKIWDNVKNKNIGELFIHGKVMWSENVCLGEYLDFNRLCSVPLFINLFFLGVKRFSGCCNLSGIKYQAIDLLVDSLVSRLNDFHPLKNNCSNVLYVGSVFVEGITVSDAIDKKEDDIVLHCFKHPLIENDSIMKLFVWPKKKWIENNFKKTFIEYRRIGRTSAIAPDGWQYYPVPRYMDNEESFYYLSPRKTYLLWQNPQIGLRLGHFKYGNGYDFIKINIKAIIEKSFLEKSELSRYLVTSFFYALGGKDGEEILDPDYRVVINISETFKKKSIILYPNHPNNNIIIEKISEIISPELMERVLPLNYVRADNTKTNIIFSPLNFQKIKSYIEKEQMGVVFFDDAVVSGRTKKEVEYLMLSFGVHDLRTIAIIDRQRFPYSVPNKKMDQYYCRLDVPRLGVGSENMILMALNDAKRTLPLIQSAKTRISEWCERWSFNNSIDNFNSNVLYPISINPICKKFSTRKKDKHYEQIGGEKNKILITNSIGLNTYCLELFCVTGRDDLVLKYCNLIDNNRVKVELICAHILLYGKELRASLRCDMLIELLKATNYLECDAYSSLSAITILTQESDLLFRISRDKAYYNNCNYDIQIAFAISSLSYEKEGLIDSYNNIVCKLRTANNQGLINIVDFHRQIYEKRKSHISPLYAIINGNRPIEVRVNALKTSLEKLVWHCENLFPAYGINNVDMVYKGIHDCQNLITNYYEDNKSDAVLKDIIIVVEKNILPSLINIHARIFIDITSKEKNIIEFIENIIQNAPEEREVMVKYMVSASGFDVLKKLCSDKKLSMWIPMNKNIERCISDIITNSKHVGNCSKCQYKIDCSYSSEISDPFSDVPLPLSSIWYSFDFDDKGRRFAIKIANKIYDENCIEKCNTSKHIKEFEDYNLDIHLKYEVVSDSILVARIDFPII